MKHRKYLVIILIIVIFFGLGCISNTSTTSNYETNPIYKTVDVNIVDGIISVSAGGYQYYWFTVQTDVNVYGEFTAFGGSGNDIIIYILDETAFTNWINGHSVGTYYNSGKMTTGHVNVNLSPGKYYLIYSNTFSTFSSKSVKTKVNYQYTTYI